MNIIKFNTGRTYSDAGQRIAAQQLESGEIVIFDLDRHIDVMLPFGVKFTQKEIMWAYDLNFYMFPSDIGMSYPDYYEIVNALRELASTVKPIN